MTPKRHMTINQLAEAGEKLATYKQGGDRKSIKGSTGSLIEGPAEFSTE